jgi:serine/threonine-protein kinase
MTTRSSRIGEVLAGKYRLDVVLGAGGMGEVYRAENLALGRNVAIKLIREEHGGSAELVTRFLREARTANAVRHPNVVDILDVGQAEDGTPFIVQELLEGEDLAHYTKGRGGKLALREALDVLLPAIDAVAFAHARGVIHRDLKPENIFLSRDHKGALVPKLLDFGISRHVTAEDQRMTATGMTVGTPAYMSPELIRAERTVDARADVWALGVILYETLAGVLPYQSSAPSALFVKIVTEAPLPLRTVMPEASPELAAVVEKCLAARPDDRFPTAADLARELRVLSQIRVESDGSDLMTKVRSAPPRPIQAPDLPIPAVVPDLKMPPSRAAAPQAPELDVPASSMPRPNPTGLRPGVQMPAVGEDYGDMSLELIPMSDRRLSLAEDPRVVQPPVPTRVARASLGNRGTVMQDESGGSVHGLVGLGMMWFIVLVITAGLSAFVPGEWPIVQWATTLDGAPAFVVLTLAGLLAVLGIGAIIAGARAEPVSWGLLVAGPGLIVDGVILSGFCVHALPSLAGTGGLDALARIVFPWPTSLVPVGVCMLFLRQAWWSWSEGSPGRSVTTALKVVIAALALFGAVQILRSAENAAQGTNIAS